MAGDFIEAAAEEISADHQVVLDAVEVIGHAFESALAELQASVSFVLSTESNVHRVPLVSQGECHKQVSGIPPTDVADRLRDAVLRFTVAQVAADRQLVVASAQESGGALHFAMAEVAADHAALRRTVEIDRQQRLLGGRGDTDLDRSAAAAAARRAQLALRLATEKLNAICETVLSIAQRCRSVVTIAERELAGTLSSGTEPDDAAVARSERMLDEAWRKLDADREVAMAVVRASTLSLRHAATELRADRTFALRPMTLGIRH